MDVTRTMFAMEADVNKRVTLFVVRCVRKTTRAITATAITNPAGLHVEMGKDASMADAKTSLADRDAQPDLFVTGEVAIETEVANVPRPVPRATDVMMVIVTY